MDEGEKFFFCILLFLFVSSTRNKQRDITMLVKHFLHNKRMRTHTKKTEGKKKKKNRKNRGR